MAVAIYALPPGATAVSRHPRPSSDSSSRSTRSGGHASARTELALVLRGAEPDHPNPGDAGHVLDHAGHPGRVLSLAEAPAPQAEQPSAGPPGARTLDAEGVADARRGRPRGRGRPPPRPRPPAGRRGSSPCRTSTSKRSGPRSRAAARRPAATAACSSSRPPSISTVTVTVGTPSARPHAADARATPAVASASCSKSARADEPVQALDPARRRGPGHVGLLGLGAAGGDARKLHGVQPLEPPRLHAGVGLQRPVGTRPGPKARGHVVHAAGQPRTAGAVAELHPGAAVVVLADDVDLGVGRSGRTGTPRGSRSARPRPPRARAPAAASVTAPGGR